MEGYVCCGKPFFGYWMGPILVLGIIIALVYGVRQFWHLGNNLELRKERAAAAAEGHAKYFSRLLLTNWSMADEANSLRAIATFLESTFANGPYEFASDACDECTLFRHGPKKGYNLNYEEDERLLDAGILYNVLKSWSDRADIIYAQKRRPLTAVDYDTPQMDNRGEYVRTAAELSIRYSLPMRGTPKESYLWTFTFFCKMRVVGPDPEHQRSSWLCFEAKLNHQHARTD